MTQMLLLAAARRLQQNFYCWRFIVVTVGGITYTLPVKTVNNNTSLTLWLKFVYTGRHNPALPWSAVPRVALNMVTAALAQKR